MRKTCSKLRKPIEMNTIVQFSYTTAIVDIGLQIYNGNVVSIIYM